jgi:hypothetical protein
MANQPRIDYRELKDGKITNYAMISNEIIIEPKDYKEALTPSGNKNPALVCYID